MRLAFLTPDWTPNGGIATHVRLVSATLAAAGHRVHVLHRHASDGVAVAGATIEQLKSGVDPAMEQLLAFRPDVVHVHGLNDAALEPRVLSEFPATKTMHVFDYCPSGTKFHHALDRNCTFETSAACVVRQAYLRCTLSKRPNVWWSQYRRAATLNAYHRSYRQMIVASQFVKDEAVRTGYDPSQIEVVPYFTAVPARVAAPRANHLLFVGRLIREKGVDLLIDALAGLPASWTATVVGEGLASEKIRAHAAARGVATRMTFPGWLNGAELEAEFAAASVVAVPSRWPEPFGIVGIEAMARGRPVVAFRVGGIPEWLDDGVAGFLVPPFDTQRFGERVQWLLSHPADAARMGEAGRARIERQFNGVGHVQQLMNLYQRLSDQH